MVEFSEIQKYSWFFDTVVVTVLLLIIRFFWRYSERKAYLLFLLPFVLIAGYLMAERLYTRIDDAGIHYRIIPWQRSETIITWDRVEYVKISKTIVYSHRTSRYDVYTLSSGYGLYIFRKVGRPVIIGTNKPDEVRNTILTTGHGDKIAGDQGIH